MSFVSRTFDKVAFFEIWIFRLRIFGAFVAFLFQRGSLCKGTLTFIEMNGCRLIFALFVEIYLDVGKGVFRLKNLDFFKPIETFCVIWTLYLLKGLMSLRSKLRIRFNKSLKIIVWDVTFESGVSLFFSIEQFFNKIKPKYTIVLIFYIQYNLSILCVWTIMLIA